MTRTYGIYICLLFVALCVGAEEQRPVDPISEARALIARGLMAEAETVVDQYLRSNPAAAEGHYVRAEILFREQKAKQSLAEFTEGAKGRRPSAREFGLIASDYVLLSDFTDADRWFTEAAAAAPNEANYWYLLGRTKYKEAEYDGAIASFERALSLHPHYVEAENNRGLAFSALQKKDSAMQAFQRAIDWQGDAPTDAQPYFNLGTMLIEANDLVRGIALLSKAVMLFPTNPRMHEELGKAYAEQGDLVLGQRELEAAVALSPGTSSLHFRLGQVYKKRALHALAAQEFAICEKLAGTHSSEATPNPFGPESLDIK